MTQEQCIGFLQTPPLWKNEQFSIRQFEFPQIALEGFVSQKIPTNIRLGHQMEHVFKQLIEHSPRYDLLICNLPVKEGKQTIGEIDFILQETATEKRIHVELTYKFYIIDDTISEPVHRLMGPNRRDMFFTKMEKIKTRQFQLLHTIAGSKALKEKNIDSTELHHQCCFKAQLFIPYTTTTIRIRPLNKACFFGFWLCFDDFNRKEFNTYEYYIPYKSEWVIAPHLNVAWSSHFETVLDINLRMLKENSPMVWMKKSSTVFEKFFVVWW